MKRYFEKSRPLSLTGLAIILGLVVLTLSAIRKPTAGFVSPQEKERNLEESARKLRSGRLRVANKTRAFELIGVEELDATSIQLTLKNNYDQKITGFQVSVGGGRVQTDLAVGGDDSNFVDPEGTYKGVYTIQPETESRGITILAVVLEDGTTDGDTEAIEEIQYYRVGMKRERVRVLTLLQDALKADDSKIVSALGHLENEILSVPMNQDKTLPYSKYRRMYNTYFGTSDERMRIAREFHSIMQEQDTLHVANRSQTMRSRILGLVEYYERIIRKL